MNREENMLLKDSDLISQAKEGDIDAFGVLYKRYIDLIFRYIRCRVAEDHTAEDLTETVFLKAFQALDRYKERGWPFSAFLYQIARNQLTDHYRRQRDEISLEEVCDLKAPSKDLDRSVMVDERFQVLRDALEKLPEDYQEIIRLRIMLDIPSQEVATYLKRSEGAIRVLLHRALKALRKQVS